MYLRGRRQIRTSPKTHHFITGVFYEDNTEGKVKFSQHSAILWKAPEREGRDLYSLEDVLTGGLSEASRGKKPFIHFPPEFGKTV